MEYSGFQIAVTLAALLVGGFLKGVTGLGLPLIITPPLVWIFGIQQAVPMVAIVALITNLIFICKYYKAWREVLRIWPMLAVGSVAIVVGVLALRFADPQIIAIFVSLLGIGYVILNLTKSNIDVPEKWLPQFSIVIGLVSGFFHGTTGISGPTIIIYLNNLKDFSRDAYFQALGIIFLVFGMQQITGYLISGIYTREIIQLGLFATIPVLVSFYLGNYLQSKLDEQKFKVVTFLLILVSCLGLLFNSL